MLNHFTVRPENNFPGRSCEQFYVNFFVFKSEGAKESLEEKEEPLWKDGNKKQMRPQKLIFFR